MTNLEATVDKNVAKLEAQLKLWSAKLTEVAAKVNVAGQQAKIDSSKHLDELKAKLEVARSKLDEAKVAGSAKWETLKTGIEHSWKDLEVAFTKLIH